MRNLIVSFLFLLIGSVYSVAQDTSQLKRTPYKLIIAVDKNSSYEEDIKATAYVLPDTTQFSFIPAKRFTLK